MPFIIQVQSVISVIRSLEQHTEKQDADIIAKSTTNATDEVTCVLPTASTQAEEVARGIKRTREAASSETAAQARSKKRSKLAPLPIISIRERAEEEADDNIQATQTLDPQKSTLDDNDQSGGGQKGTAGSPAASKGRSAPIPFEVRFKALMAFKAEFGHCNVPTTKFGKFSSLGSWCSNVRGSYKHLQNGKIPHTKLPDEGIRRLEEAGFKWSPSQSKFDERFQELMKFKEKFGHCNAPQTQSSGYYSLGCWCKELRHSYKKIQEKGNASNTALSADGIRRLEKEGFMWVRFPRK